MGGQPQQASSLASLGLTAAGGRNPRITGLTVDSRAVEPGTLFAALPGANIHGATFVAKALQDGATAILTDAEGAQIAQEALAGSDAAVIVAQDPRQALAQTAALWFGRAPETIVAVTGTPRTISIITRRSRPISKLKWGCLHGSCPKMAWPS